MANITNNTNKPVPYGVKSNVTTSNPARTPIAIAMIVRTIVVFRATTILARQNLRYS